MLNQFERSELVLGKESTEILKTKRVAVFGIGGVGGAVCEVLARSGVGTIDIIDNDKVSVSNINRQIIAFHSTVGKYKTDVMEERIKDICPFIKVNKHTTFFLPENSTEFDFGVYDYVVDAIDTVSGKIEIIVKAKEKGVKVISAMGAGNKTNPLSFVLTDIYKTNTCPLAKVMRQELKKRNIESLDVVYSTEKAVKINSGEERVIGSLPFVPPVAGYIIGGKVVLDLLK